MMLPTFKRWLAELVLFYSNQTWLTEENIKLAFKDAQHIEEAALETIGSYIRTEYGFWPRSLSTAIRKGYAVWNTEQAAFRKKQEQEQSAASWTPPTSEQASRNVARCRDILTALRTGVRPPWAGEPRCTCCDTDTTADAYHHGRKA